MFRFAHSSKMQSASRRGFSLVELAIVVGVTGLLFGGLWRLMSSGNSQLREQTAADQMNQIVSATRNFLASQEGQALLTAQAANGALQLQLPNTAANAAGTAGCADALNTLQNGAPNTPPTIRTYCNFLPTGFWNGGVTNSYGQSYVVWIRKDANNAGVPAQNYDFTVLTTGGDVIPDASGGRIAANLGSNGGFIFSNNTCGAPVATTACGAFGSFNLSLAAGGPYGAVGGAASGHIVTQNSSTLSAAANANWLARVTIPGDTGTPPIFNTMRVPLNMLTGGTVPINMFGNAVWMNNTTAPGTGGGDINLQGGTIRGPGQINIDNSSLLTSAIALTATGATNLQPILSVSSSVSGTSAVDIATKTGCDPQATPLSCNLGINVTGSVNISEFLNAGTMRAGTFIYTSDMRLKSDIIKIPNALERLSQLNGYHFAWRRDGRADLGLMAQEVKQVFPELVHDNAVPGYMGVEYGNLIAPMVEAIKELKAQNATLSAQIKQQQAEIDLLKQRH